MSQTYPYNQPDQAYPLNQLYQQMVNYVNQQASSVSTQTMGCTPQNVQATWQTCLADPVQLRAWVDTNQLTIDQVAAYLSNWWQTHAGRYVYTQQINQDYYALPASYSVPVPPLLPWTDLINSNNMSLQAISGLFGSQYLAYTSYMNLMGSGLPLAVNITNWVGALAFAPPSFVSNAAPGIGVSISNLGTNNVTNLAMIISNPTIDANRAAQIISYPTINITGMAMIITNPAVNITYMAYVLSSPAINYTNASLVITNPAINFTTMAYIVTSPAVNFTNIGYMYAQPTAQLAGIYYTLSNVNVSATYAQSIYYSMASVAVTYTTEGNFIGFVTYNRPAVTLSANVSATWTLFYSSLDLAGYTLTMGTTGRPSVIVTYSIQMSGGAIVQQPTGAPGGYSPVNNHGGAGGGGLVIIAVAGILDGLIEAVGSSGIASVTASCCPVASGSAGGSGYIITIEGIVYTASTGGPGGNGTDCTYSSGSGGGGGYYGGPGGGGYISGGNGGSVVSTLNYSTRWSYVYTMLQFLGDEWQRYVLGRTLPTYVGATYLAGYGSGGGGGGSVSVYSYGGGGGGMGGQVVIYMHNLYAPTVNQIIAMGGTGGAAYPCGCGGAGGAGGLVYILTHKLVAFSGTINILGGVGSTGVNDSAGGRGVPNTYAIFIV